MPTLGAGPPLAPALAPPPIPYAAKKAGSTRRGPAWGAVQGQRTNDRASSVGRGRCRRLRTATGSPAGAGAAAGAGACALPAPGLALATPELTDAEGGGGVAFDREASERVRPTWMLGTGKQCEVLAFHKLHTTHLLRQAWVQRQWAPPWSDQEQPPKLGVVRHHPLHLPHVHPGPLEARA